MLLCCLDISPEGLVQLIKIYDKVLGVGGGKVAFQIGGDVQTITLVCKERRDSCSCTEGVVVGKFHEQQKVRPVVLLVVDVGMEVLFQYLIDAFCLSIGLRVVAGAKVESHVEGFSEGPEEVGDELRAMV